MASRPTSGTPPSPASWGRRHPRYGRTLTNAGLLLASAYPSWSDAPPPHIKINFFTPLRTPVPRNYPYS